MGSFVRYPTRRLRIAAILGTIAVLSSLLISVESATADTAPPVATTPASVSTDSLPTAQINGVVWDQVVVGDTVFAGGNFTTARPAGSAAGTNEVSRPYLLSYTLSTGELTSWAPVLNGQVRAMDVSPDGSTLYVVGQFTSVNGVTKNRIVAFNTATGAIVSTFAGSANGQIYAVTASNTAVYVAGTFTAVSGQQRPGTAAAFAAGTGAVLPWAPVIAGGRAFDMKVSPDSSKVVIVGNFTTLNANGNPGYGQGAVNTTDGASVTWIVGTIIRNAGSDAALYSLDSDGSSIYATGYTFGAGGNLEGAFKATWADGTLEWVNNCIGDEYSIAVAAGGVYIAGHPHSCSNMDNFPQTNPWTWYRGLAFSQNAGQTLTTGNFSGRPAPTQLHFYPNMNQGTFTGQAQGPWSVDGNANYVVYAGEFTQVNNQPQQGLARFAVSSIAPNKDAPEAFGANWTPDTTGIASGAVRVSWPANFDRDNELLTYRLVRDGVTATPIYTTAAPSAFWNRPTLTYVDSGLTPGGTYTYRVSATDPFGNVSWSSTVTATAGTSGTLSSYARGVFADNPTFYFRLNESSGSAVNLAGPTANTTQAGNVTQQMNATVGSQTARSQTGAIAGDSDGAMRFTNSNNSRVYTTQQVWAENSVSVEAWFKTSTSSGKIVGFGSSSTSSSSGSYDRHIYMNGGRVIWGTYDGTQRTIQSNTGYNDNQWHQVVGTIDSTGSSLYVDGQLVGTLPQAVKGQPYWGNWRIGGDATWAGNQNFTGTIDEVAIYKLPLTAAKVLQHYQLGTGGAVANVPPTASFTSTVTNLTANLNGSASVDTDGTIASYDWNFGDGTTGTGSTTSHIYAAAGTYTVALTVTDNQGAPTTLTKSVTVTSPPPVDPGGTLAQDSFARTVASGWGTAPTGGSWTIPSATASYSVANGVGTASLTAGSTRRALLNSVLSTETTADVLIGLDKPVLAGSAYAGAVVRQVGTQFYQARARFNVGGTVGLQIMRGQSTILANSNAIAGLTYAVGQQLEVKIESSGTSPTTLKAKVWLAGTTEPATWQLTATDSTAALQFAGAVGVEAYLSASATNAPIVASFDNFSAIVPGGAPANVAPTASFSSSTAGLSASVDASASTDSDGSIATYAWNFGDGATANGVTASHAYAAAGTYTVQLTVTDNGGLTSTTSSAVTVSAVNVAPTATFTSSVTNLTAAVNAAGSTDADGSIVTYAWTFGDGATATGVTASHAYAAAGTYTVGLTVTDNQGATSSTSSSVTVTDPPPVTVIAQDAFERTVAAGWGSATTGGAWSAAANASYTVAGGTANASHPVATTRRALLTAVGVTATDITTDIAIDKAATGGGVSVGVVGRQVGATFYQARVRFIAGGTVGLQILNGSSTVLVNLNTVAGITYTPGQQLRVRVLTTGTNPTTISAKVWAVGSTEPATWQLTTTDATAALQAPGSVGVESYLSGSATNAPLVVSYDNYTVIQP